MPETKLRSGPCNSASEAENALREKMQQETYGVNVVADSGMVDVGGHTKKTSVYGVKAGKYFEMKPKVGQRADGKWYGQWDVPPQRCLVVYYEDFPVPVPIPAP